MASSDSDISDDVDADSDVDQPLDIQEEHPHKRQKTSKENLYKPPTNDELSQLKETENLYHSSLFRMQITELLKEVLLKEKRKLQINKALDELVSVLKSLPVGEEHDVSDQKWIQTDQVRVPLIRAPHNVKGKFRFQPPHSVHVGGSYNLDTCVKPDVHVDILVLIPKGCLQSKDYLNHRYLRKRALYLACLAMHLRLQSMVESILFSYHHGNHLKPIAILRIKGSVGKAFTVHLHVIPEDGSFKRNRFHPAKNNVRRDWFCQNSELVDQSDESNNEPPTPVYNAAVLGDLTMLSNLEQQQKALENCQGLREGITLLKVWLRQRELSQGAGCFSGHILTSYVIYLLTKKKVNKMMSSYQVVRNTLLNLRDCDWAGDGISLCADNDDPQRPDVGNFLVFFDVVFIDFTGYTNLCASLSKSIYNRVKHEAKLSLEFLDNRSLDGFQMLFMTSIPFHSKFDNVLLLSDLSGMRSAVTKLCLCDRLLDCGDHLLHACLPSLMTLLNKALDRRTILIQEQLEPPLQWPISGSPPDGCPTSLCIGLLLNTDHCNSVLDRGPAADTALAKEFRDFWGEKSELRRFQDGSICEAVVWQSEGSVSKKRLVCGTIASHVLQRHLCMTASSITYSGDELDSLLNQPVSMTGKAAPYGTGEEQTAVVMRSYEELCKRLRSFSDLPLSIHTIQGTSAAFRCTEVFPPLSGRYMSSVETDGDRQVPCPTKPCPPFIPTLKVVCLLESSGKWPENLEAMRRLKAAFHLKLSELLAEDFPVRVSPTWVDVLKEGFVFRVQLAYSREVALLRMSKASDGMLKMRDTEESLALEREVVALPKLSSTLHGLQQQYDSYSCVVRLAKRWIAGQLLMDYIMEESVELIVAHLYLNPAPYTPPSSNFLGFLRFLNFLSTFDWKLSPLFVNLNNEFTKEDYAEINTRFTKDRSVLPLMFISTPQDKLSCHWTKHLPSAQILQRLILLAQESLRILKQEMLGNRASFNIKMLFRPSLSDYNVVIRLNAKQIPTLHLAVDITKDVFIPRYSNQPKADNSVFPVTDYDPVQLYLQELRASYDELALFFYDRYGGRVITVLWKPHAFRQQPFKTSHINGRKPDLAGGGKDTIINLVPNKDAILEDFRIIGGGLVTGIEILH